ncbi:MAG: TonB-dependent receptor [Gammaproteobacteria bacterium]|nr:MAG: TonB-dependent receptor [Gammaproteobacteria bacterium]
MSVARNWRSFLVSVDHGAGSARGRRSAAFLLTWVLLGAVGGQAFASAQGATPTAGDLKQLSIEDLMNLDVTSVAKEPQRLLQAAAAIQVITADDIRRSGAASIPEVLRLADHLEVAQINAHDWAISAHGFNANLANKLLVLVDGRAVYTPLYGGVLWNVQDCLLADIERIEVISGPGGTLWGANAVNGVINIITKAARDTQGAYALAAAGNQLQKQVGIRIGATLAPDVYLRAYGKYTGRDREVTTAGTSAADSWHVGRGGFRLDAEPSPPNRLTVQGDFYSGAEDVAATGGAGLSGGNILGRWTHETPGGASMSLQLYYDHTHLSQPFPASPAAPPFFSGFPAASLKDDLDTYDLDFQYHFAWSAHHKVTWGLGYRATRESDEDLSFVRFTPTVLNQSLYSGFAQDEIMLARRVYLTVGSKLEHNDYSGLEFEPSARLQWNLESTQLLWGAISRAVRTPSRYDRDLLVPSGLINAPPPFQFPTTYLKGGPDFVSETLLAYEVGYRAAIGLKLAASVSAFYNEYHDLRSTAATPTTAVYVFPYPIFFQNNLEGETHGLEISASYQMLEWWRLRAGYDLLQEHIHVRPGEVDATGATNESADPQQQVALRTSLDLPRGMTLDAALRWVDSLHINNGPAGGAVVGIVPSYFELDAGIAWHASGSLELSLMGRNLLHAYHTEYGFPSPTREQIGRSLFGRITWGY